MEMYVIKHSSGKYLKFKGYGEFTEYDHPCRATLYSREVDAVKRIENQNRWPDESKHMMIVKVKITYKEV